MVHELVNEYIDAASTHGREDIEPKVSNAAHDCIVRVVVKLAKQDGGLLNLVPLLQHPVPNVGLWSAAHLLRVYPEQAESVLENIANGKGPIAFYARITLEEWRKGTLRMAGLD